MLPSAQAALVVLPTEGPLETFLVGLLLSVVAAKAAQLVMKHLVPRLVTKTDTQLDDIIYEELSTPVMLSILFGGAYISLLPLGLGERWMFYIRGFILSFFAVLWSYAAFRAGDRVFKTVHTSSKFDTKFIPVFENVWKLFIIVGALFGILSVWRIDITPLMASAGIAGIAVGFAAKDTVANFFGGIALYFDNTYEIGDYIILDSGEQGFVKDVGVRSTTLRTRDDEIINVPNSVLNSTKIRNQSAPVEKKRMTVPIGVAYGTDIDRLEGVLESIAEEEELVAEDPEPRSRFRQFGDSSLNYDLVCWIPSPAKEPAVRSRVNRKIYKRLGEEGIEIPYPKRDVYLREEDGHS